MASLQERKILIPVGPDTIGMVIQTFVKKFSAGEFTVAEISILSLTGFKTMKVIPRETSNTMLALSKNPNSLNSHFGQPRFGITDARFSW